MRTEVIFVFGSNLAGIHGAGAAKTAATHYGAVLGVCSGPSGHSYAIPTKDRDLKPLPLGRIEAYVKTFCSYATLWPDRFTVTRIGCGLAGYLDSEIAPMFAAATDNCYFDEAWREYLPAKRFGGTYA